MSVDEVTAIMAIKNETDINMNRKTWEQTRLICFYAIAAMQGTKEFKEPKDLFRLPWDESENTKEKGRRLTKDEFLKKAEEIKNLKHLGR